MNFGTTLDFVGTLECKLVRADGTTQDFGPFTKKTTRSLRSVNKMWDRLRSWGIPLVGGMGFAGFVDLIFQHPQVGMQLMTAMPLGALVTTAGINYLATTFVNNTNPLINFNYHTYGTGKNQGGTGTVSGATNASPIVITETAHGRTTNDLVTIAGVGGNTAANADWQINVLTANTYSLLGSTGNGAYTTGGTAQRINGAADTALTTEVASLTRVAGTQSNPSANQYKSIATVVFTGTSVPLTIVEWGLFSALTTGTLWDRRWLNTANAPSTTAAASLTSAPITITSTSDSIQTTYTLTCNAGGS